MIENCHFSTLSFVFSSKLLKTEEKVLPPQMFFVENMLAAEQQLKN